MPQPLLDWVPTGERLAPQAPLVSRQRFTVATHSNPNGISNHLGLGNVVASAHTPPREYAHTVQAVQLASSLATTVTRPNAKEGRCKANAPGVARSR
jgi:hypothetical protein